MFYWYIFLFVLLLSCLCHHRLVGEYLIYIITAGPFLDSWKDKFTVFQVCLKTWVEYEHWNRFVRCNHSSRSHWPKDPVLMNRQWTTQFNVSPCSVQTYREREVHIKLRKHQTEPLQSCFCDDTVRADSEKLNTLHRLRMWILSSVVSMNRTSERSRSNLCSYVNYHDGFPCIKPVWWIW